VRLSRAVPTTLLALAMVVPTLPAVGQDGAAAVNPSATPEAPTATGSVATEPIATDSTEATPSPSAIETAPGDQAPTARSAPTSADATTTAVDEPAAPSLVDTVAAAAAAAADDQGVLPLGDDATTCPAASIEVTWDPVPADSFDAGGYVEPLVVPTTDTDIATGIATCLESTHAVAGFDAVPTSGGGWDIHFVAPTSETEEGLEPAAPTSTKQASPDLRSPEASMADSGASSATFAQAAGSVPVPDWPSGMPAQADDLSASDPQDVCDPTDKPGAEALRDLLDRTYHTTGGYGISRNCSTGGRSEHKEGRALDWMVDSYDADQKALGDTFTEWVLSSDPWDNDFAGMRRLGIMYMIWNRRSIYSWNPEAGWRDYTGVSDHTDHVHFSMSWPGALCETTFWEATNCTGDTGTVTPDPEPARRTTQADFNADDFSDVLWYGPGSSSDSAWRGRDTGFTMGLGLNVRGVYEPLQGDFNGDGAADVLWYGPGSATDTRWNGTATGFQTSQRLQVRGVYRPLVGDFDGDGHDDVFWYGPGDDADRVWFGRATGFDSIRITVRGTYRPVSGDFDGDGRDDILWYGVGSRTDNLWRGRANRTFASAPAPNIAVNRIPLAGDFTGDGRDDVFLYGAGDAQETMFVGRADGGFDTRQDVQIQGSYRPFAGDFDGDERDDIFWYGPGSGVDWVYYGAPGGFAPARTSVSGDYQPVSGG